MIGRGKRKGAVGELVRGRGSKKDLGSRNAEGEMEVNKEMGVGMRKWVRDDNDKTIKYFIFLPVL